MELVEVFVRDFVAEDFFSVVVSRAEVLRMSLSELRRQVRQANELFAAAKGYGSPEDAKSAFEALEARRKDLALAVLRENGLGVPKEDV